MSDDIASVNPLDRQSDDEALRAPFREWLANLWSDVTDLETLVDMLRFKETMYFNKLVDGNKELAKKGVTPYNVLMRETSDTMQDLAKRIRTIFFNPKTKWIDGKCGSFYMTF